MNFLRAELKKILDMTQYREEATYYHRCEMGRECEAEE